MRGWKTTGGPSIQEWFTELGKVAVYEHLSFRMHNRPEVYALKWETYLAYINSRERPVWIGWYSKGRIWTD